MEENWMLLTTKYWPCIYSMRIWSIQTHCGNLGSVIYCLHFQTESKLQQDVLPEAEDMNNILFWSSVELKELQGSPMMSMFFFLECFHCNSVQREQQIDDKK